MVAQLLRLKLRLLGNAFKRSGWQLVGLVFGIMSGLGIAIVVVVTLVALRFLPVQVATSSVTVFGSILILGFVVVPLVFGVDDIMDPRKFALFGIPTARLATGLTVAALVGIPTIVVGMISVAQVITWTRGPLPVLFALLGAPLIVLTCVLAARVTTSIAALLLSTRRARDGVGLVGILLLFVLAVLAFNLVGNADWQHHGIRILSRIAAVAGWTPLGAVWSAPATAAAGDSGAAVLKLFIAVVFVGLLFLAWRALIRVMLVTQPRQPSAKAYAGLGLFATGRTDSASVIGQRALTYWTRDARYSADLMIIPFVPLILMVPLAIAGVPGTVLALLPVPVIAQFLAWQPHNDVARDSTAIWLHISSGTRGWQDRLGRVVAPLVVGIPVIVIGSVICAPLFGDWTVLPGILGAGFAILLTGLGLSSITSAAFPYPAVRPGDSPFAQPQSAGTASAIVQSVSFVLTLLLSAPALFFAFNGLIYGLGWSLGALGAGILVGGALLIGGIALGGRIFDLRAPEILAFTVRN